MLADILIGKSIDNFLGIGFYSTEVPRIIRKIKNDCSWLNGDLKSVVINNDPGLKIVLTAMHPYTEIESEQKENATMFHVMEGSLKLKIRKHSEIIGYGQKFTLYEKLSYKLETTEETIFLILIFS